MGFLSRVQIVAGNLGSLGKVHVVSLSSDIHEDHFEHGHGKHTGAGLPRERIGRTFESAAEMVKFLSKAYGLSDKVDDYELSPDSDSIVHTSKMVANHSEMQNGGWFEPTPDELKEWRRGALMLYTEDYSIEILTGTHFTQGT